MNMQIQSQIPQMTSVPYELVWKNRMISKPSMFKHHFFVRTPDEFLLLRRQEDHEQLVEKSNRFRILDMGNHQALGMSNGIMIFP